MSVFFKAFNILLIFFTAITIMFGVSFVIAMAIELLWNYVMPDVFGLPRIDYWQAWAMFLLSAILFKDTFIGGKK